MDNNNNFGRSFDYLKDIERYDKEINNQYLDINEGTDNDDLNDEDIEKVKYDKKKQEYYKLVTKDSKLFSDNENNIKIYNLSLKNIVINFTKYIIEMLDELIDYVNNYYILKNHNKNMLNELIEIFIKKDRLIYTGIFFILLSFIFYFMDISS